jgi:hypothetical protein
VRIHIRLRRDGSSSLLSGTKPPKVGGFFILGSEDSYPPEA